MFVLDTNVASELMRPEPTPTVKAWIADRILPFDSSAALAYAVIASGRRAGRPIGQADCLIAEIVMLAEYRTGFRAIDEQMDALTLTCDTTLWQLICIITPNSAPQNH